MVGELCLFLCVCGGGEFRAKVTRDEHGEGKGDQNLKVLLGSPSTCCILGMGVWKLSLLKASSLIGRDANLKSEKKNQSN